MKRSELFHQSLNEALPGSVEELSRFLGNAITQLPIAALNLRGSDHKSGYNLIASATDGFELILTCITILEDCSSQSKGELARLRISLCESLECMNTFMEQQSRIDIADLIEFELVVILTEIHTFIFDEP